MARILVVEDNPTNLDLMVYLLKAFGHTTLVARNGREGIDALRLEQPDLALVDVHMPLMDGHEMVRILRSEPGGCPTPLIAVTALAMVGDREKVITAGFDGYISKPIDPVTFVREVDQFLAVEKRSVSPPKPAAGVAPAAPLLMPQKATLLVVDDLPQNLHFTTALFAPFGYRVLTATTVGEALRTSRQERPDLILADFNLVGESALDLVAALRADAALRDVPVIVITSTAGGAVNVQQVMELGARRFLRRPIEPQTLLVEVENCLRGEGDS